MATRTYEPAQVRTKEERKRGGSFISLKKEGESLVGWALFKADVEAENNHGYYEYWCHYTPATGFMPCPGSDVCPVCEEGDTPNTRAKTAWLVPKDEDDPDPANAELKFFEFNYSLIQEFSDDGSDSLGQMYRVRALAKKGAFSVRSKTNKLTKAQLNAALKQIDEGQLKAMTKKQMLRTLEEMDVETAMERDEDDQPPAETTSRRGRPKDEEPEEEATSAKSSKTARSADTFDPETEDVFEGVVTLLRAPTKDNTAQVETEDGAAFKLFGTDDSDLREFAKGDTIEISAGKDQDDDWVADSVVAAGEAADDQPSSDDGDAPATILENVKATITSINSHAETMNVELEDGAAFELFFLDDGEAEDGSEWKNFDVDDYKEDQVVTISCHRDEEGDMLADAFPQKATAARGRKTRS